MSETTESAPMTRAELAGITKQLLHMAVTEGRIVARLVTEVHRLRLKTRLQRRTIAELGMPIRTVVSSDKDDRDEEEATPIRAPEDFIVVLAAAIQNGRLENLVGLDDEGADADGSRLVALLRSDEGPRVRVRVDVWPSDRPADEPAPDSAPPFLLPDGGSHG